MNWFRPALQEGRRLQFTQQGQGRQTDAAVFLPRRPAAARCHDKMTRRVVELGWSAGINGPGVANVAFRFSGARVPTLSGVPCSSPSLWAAEDGDISEPAQPSGPLVYSVQVRPFALRQLFPTLHHLTSLLGIPPGEGGPQNWWWVDNLCQDAGSTSQRRPRHHCRSQGRRYCGTGKSNITVSVESTGEAPKKASSDPSTL